MFVNKYFDISKVRISQKMKDVILCNLLDTVFYMKPTVLQDFHICISVPLRTDGSFAEGFLCWGKYRFW